MSTTVCIAADSLLVGGGLMWEFINWAHGLRALDCRVIWLEMSDPSAPAYEEQPDCDALKSRLEPYGLAESVALCSWSGDPLPRSIVQGCMGLEAAVDADLLLNLGCIGISSEVVERFRRTALVDLDPGLVQMWMSKEWISISRHDVYFTIGETVGQADALFPDAGLKWHYTPPCVALDLWLPHRAAGDTPFTTVSSWHTEDWVANEEGQPYKTDKRMGFLPFLDLPVHTPEPLELALSLVGDEERAMLQHHGWRVRDAAEVASTPWDYQSYIQDSRGEFSWAKPGYVHLQTAWISDRTLCYLASGKPAVVQHTGPSRFLPDSAGLFRFHDIEEAARLLEVVASDYEQQCKVARALVEEYFDAKKVVRRVLERALA